MPLNCDAVVNNPVPATFVGKVLGQERENYFNGLHRKVLESNNFGVPEGYLYETKAFLNLLRNNLSQSTNYHFFRVHFTNNTVAGKDVLGIIFSFSELSDYNSSAKFFGYDFVKNAFVNLSQTDAAYMIADCAKKQLQALNKSSIITHIGATKMMWLNATKALEMVEEFEAHNSTHIEFGFAAYSQNDADNGHINLSQPPEQYVNKAFVQVGMVDIVSGVKKALNIEDCPNFNLRKKMTTTTIKSATLNEEFNSYDMCPPNVNCNDEG
jgi:hypothetical protein